MTWEEGAGLSDSRRLTLRRPELQAAQPAKRATLGCGPGNASLTVKSIQGPSQKSRERIQYKIGVLGCPPPSRGKQVTIYSPLRKGQSSNFT